MNARSISRAAERKARKESKKIQISDTQLTADRANAQLSTGPRTDAGKRTSSLNAVKTGLTGQTVLLPSDDATLYENHLQRFIADHQPEAGRESELVQSLADAQWRLNRIPGLEMAIFARGRIEFAEKFAEYDESMAAALVDGETIVVYQRELRNLHTQEGRLRRHYEKDLAELKDLQAQRAASDRPARPLPPPPPLAAMLSGSAQAAARGAKQKKNLADVAAAGESVAREFLNTNGFEFSDPNADLDHMNAEQLENEILRLEAELAGNRDINGPVKKAA